MANDAANSHAMISGAQSPNDQQETIDEGLANSTNNLPRLFRVRISRNYKTGFSASRIQGAVPTHIGTTKITFGGPMTTLRSRISMELP
jgi:hypothetical protein